MQPSSSLKFFKIFFIFLIFSCATFKEKEFLYEEEGLASWYGKEYHGQKTSSGETFNMYEFTAAHRTLPFGTIVEVFCYETKKSVKVKINDRGPFLPGRIIDLSYAAAKELGIVALGVSKVKIKSYGKSVIENKNENFNLIIQVGAFKIKENAEKLMQILKEKYQKVYLEDFEDYKRVLIGPFTNEKEVENIYNSLLKEGFKPLIRKL